jgi:hypothetical protein
MFLLNQVGFFRFCFATRITEHSSEEILTSETMPDVLHFANLM